MLDRVKLAFCVCLLCVLGFELKGQTIRNDLAFPSHTYFLENVENYIYFQPLIKRWLPYTDFVRVKTANMNMHTDKHIMISSPKDNDMLYVTLLGGTDLDTLKSIQSVVHVGLPGKGEDSIRIQFLGDSYTQGLYFKHAFIQSDYVPDALLVGTRRIGDTDCHAHEGRGGWTVARYFSDMPDNPYFYNPFWQPEGELFYWGNTAFWKNCQIVNSNDSIKEFNLRYNCSFYDVSAYDQDGKRKNPKKHDLMWDSLKKEYITWDGKQWRKCDVESLEWSFNYQKYLLMNQMNSPDYLVVMLGLNDFRNGNINPDFSLWNKRIELMFQSYKKAVPEGVFILCIPCSSCGVMNNKAGDFTVRQNLIMWKLRKNIIDVFDNRFSEGLYIVDTAATIDNEGGYNYENGVQTGNPHPYPNYPKIGIPIAALIQYLRNRGMAY